MSRLDTGQPLNVHKLTNVEAQRIMLILEETFVKLSLLSYVPAGTTPDDTILPELIGPEIHQVLREQAVLEQQYEAVSNPSGADVTAGLPDFETLDDELRHSSRVVARMVMDDRVIVDKIEAAMPVSDRDPSLLKFLGTFSELKSQTYQKMTTTVEEEKSKEDFYLEVSAREEKASQMLRALQKDLKAEKAEHEAEVSALDETILKLRNEIDHIKSSTSSDIRNLEETTRVREDDDKQAWQHKEEHLASEIARLKADLASAAQRNRDTEEALRKKKIKNENEVQEWIKKYDEDVREKVNQYRALKKEYDSEKQQLEWYQEYFSKVEAERAIRDAEQEKIHREKAKEAAEKAILDRAATVFQRIFRGKMARRELEKVKKGKKGKGNKGKGGKGGKGKKKK